MKIGVVGAGVFGGHHAAKISAHPSAVLSGIADADPARARALADREGVDSTDLDELVARSDAVVVASPATAHAAAALTALRAGRHVLVEKPIAATLADAEAMVGAARQSGAVLQVGHQERFVAQAIGLSSVEEMPLSIRSWRHSTPSPRGRDVSVTLDLMTHDIDLVLWLLGRESDSVAGQARRSPSGTIDRAEAVLRFPDTTVFLSASRIAAKPQRRMEIAYGSGTVSIDFAAKTLVNTSRHPLAANFGDDPRARDSLASALEAFVDAVRGGGARAATGEMGLRALRYALKVDASATGENHG